MVNRRNRGIHLLFGSLSQLRSAATSSPESTAMKGRVCSLLGSPPGQAPWDLIKVQQDSNSRTEQLMQAPNSPSVFLGPSSLVPVTLTRRTGWLCSDGGLAGGSPMADTGRPSMWREHGPFWLSGAAVCGAHRARDHARGVPKDVACYLLELGHSESGPWPCPSQSGREGPG